MKKLSYITLSIIFENKNSGNSYNKKITIEKCVDDNDSFYDIIQDIYKSDFYEVILKLLSEETDLYFIDTILNIIIYCNINGVAFNKFIIIKEINKYELI